MLDSRSCKLPVPLTAPAGPAAWDSGCGDGNGGSGAAPVSDVGRRVRLWLARWLHRRGQLWRANFSVPISIEDGLLRIPILLGHGLQNLGMSDPWLLETMRRLFARRQGAFLDVGMNAGQTLIKAKALDRSRPYFGFEPNVACCQYVEHLIRVNRFRSCTIVPAGLSDRPGVALLRTRNEVTLDPCATLVEGFVFGHEGLDELRVASLLNGDEILERLDAGEVGVMKVDVEGAELEALRGLERTLRASRPHVICEILPVMDASRPTGRMRIERQEAVLHLIRSLGYRVYRVYDDAEIEPIESIGVHTSLFLSNYIFVPERHEGALLDDFDAARQGRSLDYSV